MERSARLFAHGVQPAWQSGNAGAERGQFPTEFASTALRQYLQYFGWLIICPIWRTAWWVWWAAWWVWWAPRPASSAAAYRAGATAAGNCATRSRNNYRRRWRLHGRL